MSNPKRQHVVPKMLLKHFTDERGQIWCWRRGTNRSLFQSTPSNAFTSRHFYTRFSLDGDKDFSLEKHWDSLEAKMEPILARLLNAVRAGIFPDFLREDWVVWLWFYYALRTRSPLEAQEHSENAGLRSQAEEVLAKCHAVEGVSSDIRDRLPSAQWLEKEVILREHAAGPSPTSAEFLANCGLHSQGHEFQTKPDHWR